MFKLKNINDATKASVAFMICSFFSQGIAFITTPIFTRILTKAEYGQVALFNTWYQILAVFTMLGLSYGVYNNGILDFKNDKNVFTNSMLALSNGATIIVMLLFGGIVYLGSLDIGFPKQALLVCVFIFMVQPAYNFWSTGNRFEYKYKALTIVTMISTLLSSVLSVIMVVKLNYDNVMCRIIGSYTPLIIVYIFLYIMIVRKAKGKVKIEYWKYALSFNLPLIPHYLSNYLLNGADRIMIEKYCGKEDVAIYSLSYSIASIVMVVWQAINSSLIPFTYKKCEEKNFKRLNNVVKKMLLLYGTFCVVLMFFLPEIFSLMANKDYRAGIYVSLPIICGCFLSAFYAVFANVIYYYKKPQFVMIASVVSAFMNIALNIIFIKKFGYIAAGYTTLICYFIQACINCIAMRHVVRKENVYEIKYFMLITVMVILFSIIMNALFMVNIIRYMIMLIILILVIINRKKVISLINEVRQ